MHFFTSEKLISLFVVFEILLPCCLTDDSGSGARGGGISGCEGDLPGEILTTGMFISTFCGLGVLFKSTLPGTPDRPYPPSSETFGGVKACFSVGVGSTCGELSACCCSRSFTRARIFSFKTSSIIRSFLLLLHTWCTPWRHLSQPTFLTWIGEAVFSLMTGLPTPNTETIEPIKPVSWGAFTWSWEARPILRPGLYKLLLIFHTGRDRRLLFKLFRHSSSLYRVFSYHCWVHSLMKYFFRCGPGGGERLRQAVATKHEPHGRWLNFWFLSEYLYINV